MAHYKDKKLTPQREDTMYQDLRNTGVQQYQQINTEPFMQQPQICIAPTTEQQIYTEPGDQQTQMYGAPTIQNQYYTEPVTQNFRTSDPSTMHQQMHAGPTFQQHQMYRGPIVQNEMHHAHQILQHTDIYKHDSGPEIPQEVKPLPQPTIQSHRNNLQNKTWRSKSDLPTNNAGHTVKSYLKCDVCGESFRYKSYLDRHYSIHTEEKPYNCDLCHKKFNFKDNLKMHRLNHTGEKPDTCDECGICFQRKGHLERHLLIHTGEKPHTCKECGVGFVRKDNLERHLLIHTGEKTYTCDKCDAVFTQKNNLNRHLLIHTREKPHVYVMQKNLTEMKNTNESKDQEDKLNIDDTKFVPLQQEALESKVDQEQEKVHFDSQNSHFVKESENCQTAFPENDGYHGQAIFNTIPINDHQPYTTLEHQSMNSIGVSIMYPIADDLHQPNCLDGVNEPLAGFEGYLQENDPEAEVTQRGQDDEKCQQFNPIQTVPVSIQEAPEPRTDQYQQEVHGDPQLVRTPIESDNCEIVFPGKKDHHQHPVSPIDQQISMENYQEFSTIDFTAIQLSFNHSS